MTKSFLLQSEQRQLKIVNGNAVVKCDDTIAYRARKWRCMIRLTL